MEKNKEIHKHLFSKTFFYYTLYKECVYFGNSKICICIHLSMRQAVNITFQ